MQQHTGQHLLSAAFVELFRIPTVSFHLGSDSSTIDVASASLLEDQLEAAEKLTNQIIFEDRPVEIQFATREELATACVRKEVSREGLLRAINIKDFDLQPCGGTHVSRTGQVGLVLLRKVEKQKQNWRVEFVCGGRALRSASEDYKLLNEAARLLSCGRGEVPAILGMALEERKQTQCERQLLQEELADLQAEEMLRAAKSESGSSPLVMVRIFENADAAFLRLVATRLVRESGVQALLATKAGGHLVFAQSSGLTADLNAVLRNAAAAAGGKGGGTRDFAQGKVPDVARLEEVMDRAAKSLGV
jgi:alanyl-tRNA synthetase